MSVITVSIKAPVGLRNGKTMLTNNQKDLDTVTDLFDRIDKTDGGTADVAGDWFADRPSLIQQVADQIAAFQYANNLTVDSTLDPHGRGLRLMNQLADDLPLIASVDAALSDIDLTGSHVYAAPASVAGTQALGRAENDVKFSRFLVQLSGSTIKWFGVMIPTQVHATIGSTTTHIFFTPSPGQHPAYDHDYDTFKNGWAEMWDNYTWTIGAQISLATANQIVVIPFYKGTQWNNLGGFLSDWSDAITQVVRAAIGRLDPDLDATDFSVGAIVSSSFSNGITTHKHFQSAGVGTTAVTKIMFDLDGGASGTVWAPSGMVTYRNSAVSANTPNPSGSKYLVGSRWANFYARDPHLNTHSACVDHLLMHGVFTYCRMT